MYYLESHPASAPAPASTPTSTTSPPVTVTNVNKKDTEDPKTTTSSTVITSTSSSSSSTASDSKSQTKRSLLKKFIQSGQQPPVIFGTWARFKTSPKTLKTYYFELNQGTLYWSENEPTQRNKDILSTYAGSCFLAGFEASSSVVDKCVIVLTGPSSSSSGTPSKSSAVTAASQMCILFVNEALQNHWLKLFDRHKLWARFHPELGPKKP